MRSHYRLTLALRSQTVSHELPSVHPMYGAGVVSKSVSIEKLFVSSRSDALEDNQIDLQDQLTTTWSGMERMRDPRKDIARFIPVGVQTPNTPFYFVQLQN